MARLLAFVALALSISNLSTAAPTPANKSLAALPTNAANGIYLGDLDAAGNTVWTFVGPGNLTSITLPSALDARDPESDYAALEKRDGVSCAGWWTNADNVNVAQGMLANQFGGGLPWYSHSIAATYNSGVAYGCNYGNMQVSYSSQFWSDMAAINSQCGYYSGGSAQVGWYSHDSWKSSYGRIGNGAGFC